MIHKNFPQYIKKAHSLIAIFLIGNFKLFDCYIHRFQSTFLLLSSVMWKYFTPTFYKFAFRHSNKSPPRLNFYLITEFFVFSDKLFTFFNLFPCCFHKLKVAVTEIINSKLLPIYASLYTNQFPDRKYSCTPNFVFLSF